jgi:polar amino acid transport system substrate-binding protein
MSKKVLVVLIALSLIFALVLPTSSADRSLVRVKGAGVLKVGMDVNELPWAGVDLDTGKRIGFEVELAELLAKRLGVKLEIVSLTWASLPNALLEGKFDVVGNAWTPEPETEKTIGWSKPYFEWGLMIAVRKNNNTIRGVEDLRGKVVGRYDDPTTEEIVRAIPGLKELKTYTVSDDGYAALKSGRIDAFIYDSVALLYIAKEDPAIKVVGRRLNTSTYNYGVRKADAELLKAIDSALVQILSSKEYKDIMSHWQ